VADIADTTGATAGFVRHAVPPVVAALAATVLTHVVPLLGPLLVALFLGVVVANTRYANLPLLKDHAVATRGLLRLGVVLIGLRLPFGDIATIGVRGVLVIAVTVLTTHGLTRVIGARTRLDSRFVILIAAGFSICGAAAIAAINDAVSARQRDVALAVALVTLYGSAMIVTLPWLAGWMKLSDEQAALWAGASVHEVAQVVAVASVLGTGAISVALTVKLGRVALLAPVYLLAARDRGPGRGPVPLVPWFLTGFALMVGVRSLGLLPDWLLSAADPVTSVLLAAGMFGLGLGCRGRDLWPVPGQALALATASTVVAAGTSLALITALY
jgi:uncharacterized integral membrane protein (TIGR00698 family)